MLCTALSKNPFDYYHPKWTMVHYNKMVNVMKPLVCLDIDLIVNKIQELDPNIGPQPPVINGKWKDDKIRYCKRGRHQTRRCGGGGPSGE